MRAKSVSWNRESGLIEGVTVFSGQCSDRWWKVQRRWCSKIECPLRSLEHDLVDVALECHGPVSKRLYTSCWTCRIWDAGEDFAVVAGTEWGREAL